MTAVHRKRPGSLRGLPGTALVSGKKGPESLDDRHFARLAADGCDPAPSLGYVELDQLASLQLTLDRDPRQNGVTKTCDSRGPHRVEVAELQSWRCPICLSQRLRRGADLSSQISVCVELRCTPASHLPQRMPGADHRDHDVLIEIERLEVALLHRTFDKPTVELCAGNLLGSDRRAFGDDLYVDIGPALHVPGEQRRQIVVGAGRAGADAEPSHPERPLEASSLGDPLQLSCRGRTCCRDLDARGSQPHPMA